MLKDDKDFLDHVKSEKLQILDKIYKKLPFYRRLLGVVHTRNNRLLVKSGIMKICKFKLNTNLS